MFVINTEKPFFVDAVSAGKIFNGIIMEDKLGDITVNGAYTFIGINDPAEKALFRVSLYLQQEQEQCRKTE